MRVLSGIQPSGHLHLGNYFGMMKRMVEYQSSEDLYCFIVNYHALTSQRDGAELTRQTLNATMDFLALGLDPNKCTLWVQSQVPEVTELAWILSNVTGMGLLERCHSYKDKIANGIKPSHGLFAYPVLMAADILMMQAQKIPVGKDQKQHLEVTQDIAQRFNSIYGELFTIPQPDITQGGLIPGIDGRKMAKSYDNTIEIFGSRKDLERKVMSFKTDSTPVNEPKPVEGNALYDMVSLFLDDTGQKELKDRFLNPGLKYGDIKKELVDLIWNYFEPFRDQREVLSNQTRQVLEILHAGSQKARETAQKTMAEVRERVGII